MENDGEHKTAGIVAQGSMVGHDVASRYHQLTSVHRMVEKRAFTPAVIAWGVGVGIFQAFCPMVMWWLDAVALWGVALAMIASVYVGFAVADGRRRVIVVEVLVTLAFVTCATLAIASFPWLIVIGLVAHGLKDLWQHRTQFVANTRWWPPFCLTVDFVAAALTAAVLLTGFDRYRW